ncbi:MAG: tryptophan synthase subunit alpha [Bdellovibrionales bacterium]|jgi:tryptophan synthase alpha chain
MDTINRLDARFATLKKAGQKAFIPFATAGYPNLELYPEILAGFPKAGADIIEIGMPFSDPMADGPAIQTANLQAFKAGITVPKILNMVRDFRKTDNETPIILMGYYNPIYSYGIMRFLDDARKAGVDAFIIPDLPPEEDAEFRLPAAQRDMLMIRLVTPTTDAGRLPTVLKDAQGFLYCVSIAGITGAATATAASLGNLIGRVREKSTLPIAIGFGVSTPEQAHEMASAADAVIVGSAIMTHIAKRLDGAGNPREGLVREVLSFTAALAQGAHKRC